jgi:hypothetical protein
MEVRERQWIFEIREKFAQASQPPKAPLKKFSLGFPNLTPFTENLRTVFNSTRNKEILDDVKGNII